MKSVWLLQWLYACWLVRRAIKDMRFSEREVFFEDLRPIWNDPYDQLRRSRRISWPSAWTLIRPSDVRRAVKAARVGK